MVVSLVRQKRMAEPASDPVFGGSLASKSHGIMIALLDAGDTPRPITLYVSRYEFGEKAYNSRRSGERHCYRPRGVSLLIS